MAALALVATYIEEVEKDGCFDRTRKKDNVQKIKFIEIPRRDGSLVDGELDW